MKAPFHSPTLRASSWSVMVGIYPTDQATHEAGSTPCSPPGQRPLCDPCLSFSPECSRVCTSRGSPLGSHSQRLSLPPSGLSQRPQNSPPLGTLDGPLLPDPHSCPRTKLILANHTHPHLLSPPQPLPLLPPVPSCRSESPSLPPPWVSALLSCLGLHTPRPSLANDWPPVELSPALRTRLVLGRGRGGVGGAGSLTSQEGGVHSQAAQCGAPLPLYHSSGSHPPTHRGTPTPLPAPFKGSNPSRMSRPPCSSRMAGLHYA